MSERQELVVAVGDLFLIVQQLYSRYQDDVTPNRADDMERIYERARPIAQPIIDRYPYNYGRKPEKVAHNDRSNDISV